MSTVKEAPNISSKKKVYSKIVSKNDYINFTKFIEHKYDRKPSIRYYDNMRTFYLIFDTNLKRYTNSMHLNHIDKAPFNSYKYINYKGLINNKLYKQLLNNDTIKA